MGLIKQLPFSRSPHPRACRYISVDSGSLAPRQRNGWLGEGEIALRLFLWNAALLGARADLLAYFVARNAVDRRLFSPTLFFCMQYIPMI